MYALRLDLKYGGDPKHHAWLTMRAVAINEPVKVQSGGRCEAEAPDPIPVNLCFFSGFNMILRSMYL